MKPSFLNLTVFVLAVMAYGSVCAATKPSSAGRPSPSRTSASTFHFFLSLDTRLVAYDLTLDGNTFQRSHSVEKSPWVGEVGVGLVLTQERWKITLARLARTREFSGQQEMPKFGSLAVSYAL